VAMLIIIGCNLPNAIAILPKGYEAIAPLVIVLMLGNMIDIATGFNSELIGLSVYYKFNFRISILLLILVVTFDRIFIPIYGAYGAAWSGAASLVIFNIMKYLFLWKKMKIQPFNKNTLLVILAGLLAGLAGYFLPHVSNPVIDTIIRTTVITISYGGILLYLKPSEDLITYINSIKKNKRLF
jgi:O-antigen/teichoic acid export membrane protein